MKNNFKCFKCLVAFQKMFWKIFSGVWLYSWKYHKKYIFYLLFTFSHIFSAVKQIYNIIPQYRNTKETKSKKKIHQIRSNWEKKEEREVTGFNLEARSYGGCEGEIAWQRQDQAALELIFAWLVMVWIGAGVAWCDETSLWSSDWSSCGRRIGARSEEWSGLSLSLSLCVSPEMVWSENFHFKQFPGQSLQNTWSAENNFRKIYFPCAIKHSHLRKSIYGNDLKAKQTQPF